MSSKLMRWWLIVVLCVASLALAQTPQPTKSLSYPIREVIKRCPSDGSGSCGWHYAEYATGYPGGWVYHPGWDINEYGTSGNGDIGDIVYPAADGTVIDVNKDANGVPSNYASILIKHDLGGQTFYTVYWHMRLVCVSVGQSVEANVTQLGEIGDIGSPGSAHLHFEVRTTEHKDAGNLGYWNHDTPHGLQDYSVVYNNWYIDPEDFIRGIPIIGYRNYGIHPFRTAFYNAWLDLGGQINNNIRVWNNGPGGVYVHYWPSADGNPNAPRYSWWYEVQDLIERNDNGTPGNQDDDVYTWHLLVFNPQTEQAYAVEDAMRNFWKQNPGKGAPVSNSYTVAMALRQDFENGYLMLENNQVTNYTSSGSLVPTRFVTFNSTPSVAGIYSDDVLVGYAPFSVPLYLNYTYAYTAKMLGYQDVSQEFTVTSDMTVNFTLAGTGLTNPYGLHLVDCTTNQMTIAWNDNNAPSFLVYYKIYRNGSYFTSTSMGQKSYIDYGLTANTSYQYFVTAVKQGMESGPSETITETTLHEPTDFPVRLVARLSSDFPTRYEVDDHPEGGVGFYNTSGYIVSKDITFPQAGQYQYTLEAKCAYSGSPVMRVESQLYNTPVNIYEVVNTTSWTRFSVNFNVSGAGLVTQAKVKAAGNVSDGYPLCVDSAIVVYLGPLPPVLAVDSTALHFGSVDTLRSFHITNTGGPGLNWACSYSHEATDPVPAQGGAPATVDAYLHRAEREQGSYVDTLWVTSNGGNRTILCYYTVPDPNLLLNGGFESGFSPWAFQNWPDRGTATVTSNGGEFTEGTHGLRVSITNPDVYWMVHVHQIVSLTPQQYTLTFKAKAQSQRTMIVRAQEDGTWVNLGLWQEPVLTTNWQSFSYCFTPPQ